MEDVKVEDLPNFSEPYDEYLTAIKEFEDSFDYYNKNKINYPWGRAICWTFRWEMAGFAILTLLGQFLEVTSVWAYSQVLEIIRQDRDD